MFVTESGITTFSNDEQLLKAEAPIVVREFGKITVLSEVQFSNAEAPIDVTEEGITISVIEEHP